MLIESERRIPEAGEYDVVVVGGGIAGVAAALAGARNGAKVCLLEKMFGLGGLATLGNVIIYLPLCDGMGRQVIGGIGEELLKLSVRETPDAIPCCWREGGGKEERKSLRYQVAFNPASYMLALEEAVVGAGVDVWYDTRFCEVVKSGEKIEWVLVENKSGRLAIKCKAVVDASGDADVCARAGEEMISLRTNVRSGWFYYSKGGKVELNCLSKGFDPLGGKMPEDDFAYAGDRGKDVSEQVLETRKLIREELKILQKKYPDFRIEPILPPTIPCLRMTRRLKGRIELNETDDHRWFDDCVGMTGDWRKNGPIYYLPLRVLTAVKTTNLITAGRCISANTAWDVTRVIPTCAVTGEAAGVAAAMAAAQTEGDISKVEIADLQMQLKRQNVLLERQD